MQQMTSYCSRFNSFVVVVFSVTSTSLSLFSRSQLKKEKFAQVLVEVKLISACGQKKGQQVHFLNRSRSSSTDRD